MSRLPTFVPSTNERCMFRLSAFVQLFEAGSYACVWFVVSGVSRLAVLPSALPGANGLPPPKMYSMPLPTPAPGTLSAASRFARVDHVFVAMS